MIVSLIFITGSRQRATILQAGQGTEHQDEKLNTIQYSFIMR